ncbi:MAG: integrase arm-type DNA-binding domain-containing protein, partial [Methylobacillus sp.]|nr:integrase arm-type DNA-binding domain-containing protein [Methylobacillus sp.]
MPRLSKPLNDKLILSAKAGLIPVRDDKGRVIGSEKTTKPYKLVDGGGLYMIVTSKGDKWWRLDYRFDDTRKTISVGIYPEVSLADARQRRDDARKLLADGIDPGEVRKEAKRNREFSETNTFKAWAQRWHEHWAKGKSPRHADYQQRRLHSGILPVIGDKPITEITAPDVVKTVKAIAANGKLDLA